MKWCLEWVLMLRPVWGALPWLERDGVLDLGGLGTGWGNVWEGGTLGLSL